MSDYLIHELEHAGVVVRAACEVVGLHGNDGQLDAVTLSDGERGSPFCSCFSARRPARSGSATSSHETSMDLSSRATAPAADLCSRRALRGYSRPATSAPARPS